jgi:DNA-binding transcriptional LysR family regulator
MKNFGNSGSHYCNWPFELAFSHEIKGGFMLSWDDFRYVKAIAASRSLAAAAGLLGVNHSTVFRRLAQIEQQLGSRLFERGRAGYALTPSGEEMVQLAQRMDEDIVSFERRVTGQDLRPSGDLRVTTSDLVLRHVLIDSLVRFRRAYPEILLELVVANELLNLSKRDADVAVRAVYGTPDGLVGQKVADVAWAVFGTRALAGESFDLAVACRRIDWVTRIDSTAVARLTRWVREHVPEERIVYKGNTMVGMAEAAAAGMGLALLPCFVSSNFPQLVQLSPVLPELQGELWVLTHPDLRKTARVRAFLDFCAQDIGQRRALIEGHD